MRASVVSPEVRVARTSIAPCWVKVPANTLSPVSLLTGTDSPVRLLWSTSEPPESTIPSTGIASPGLTTTRSPTWTASASTSISRPPRRTSARAGRSLSNAWRARRVRPMV